MFGYAIDRAELTRLDYACRGEIDYDWVPDGLL